MTQRQVQAPTEEGEAQSADAGETAGTSRLLPALLLLGLLGLAFWLRWRYLRDVSLYVDEFTTLWAARWVQELGAPIMPSGVLYTRGLLASYVEAAFLTLFGFSYTAGRLPSVILSLGSIAAVFLIGRRSWGMGAGLAAAVALALLPESIIWGARARFYAQLQFFALLTVWAAWEAIVDANAPARRAWRRHGLFALFFVLALFSQEETILLYPATVAALVYWRGLRILLRPPVLVAHGVAVLAMATRYLIEIRGQPGYFETIQAERPYVGFIFDLSGAWAVYGPSLTAPARLPWTLAAVLALAVALIALARARGRIRAVPLPHQATLFYGWHFLFVLAVILLLVGTTWRDIRYLLLVQPFWLLCAGAGILWFWQRAVAGVGPRAAGVAATVLVLGALLWPQAQAALQSQVEGYDRVLDQVAADRQPGDVVLSPQPPACALVLGPCDYYAIQQGYEEYVIVRDGVAVDRWSGAELLNTAEQLQHVLDDAPRVWFITDGFRLATRYRADFLRTLLTHFEPVFNERGVLALRAEGLRPVPAPEQSLTPELPFGPLILTGVEIGAAAPGATLPVTLTWLAQEPVTTQYNSSLRLVTPDGGVVAQQDGPPAKGVIPTNLFFDQPLPDFKTLELPAGLLPGRYNLEVVLYDVATVTPLTPPQVIGSVDWAGNSP